MVSFSCEACGDVLTKKKLDQHTFRCRDAIFTCIDCMTTFERLDYRSHTSCITEAQKYQGSLYKQRPIHTEQAITAPIPTSTIAPSREPTVFMAPKPYCEDVRDSGGDSDDEYAVMLPKAPTPPPAVALNVFDFLVGSETPNASTANLVNLVDNAEVQIVRFEHNDSSPSEGVDDRHPLVQYGAGPVPTNLPPVTPALDRAPRKKTRESQAKDKKRKRLHLDITDQVMVDMPPLLHSGLTGGLNRLMRPVLPPSPDQSGNDNPVLSPTKKTRRSKSRSTRQDSGIGNTLLALVSGKSKPKKRDGARKTTSSHGSNSRPSRRPSDEKPRQLIEFHGAKDEGQRDGQIVLYQPPADLFVKMVNKGPESQRGCSINKMLKRFHRERSASGDSRGKTVDEKELWRSLRLRRNDRGEIVLFSLDES